MLHGKVFNIQRMSIHDGPGIRTTVFLKGCPLRCAWCHNPESQSSESELAYHTSRCVGCGLCVKNCPVGALSLSKDRIVKNASKCIHCLRCAEVCPYQAWEVYGYDIDADTLVESCLKDKAYYDKTNGGVTFSGGEPLEQADFVAACASALKGQGVRIAVETACFGSETHLKQLAEVTDLFMVDLKVMDGQMHQKWIGAPVAPILSNIRLLARSGADVLIRIPVVSGCNDSPSNMEATADFLLSDTSFRRIELLKMHKLAENKYDSWNRNYSVSSVEPPTEEKISDLAAVLKQRGLQVLYKGIIL